ncbi:MAG: SMC-Scp complex subunit ScpB [Phycisphaerae bacterium]|nr:SMC-Scp complex subunit ScpB [Phycisphaerae bacterium]
MTSDDVANDINGTIEDVQADGDIGADPESVEIASDAELTADSSSQDEVEVAADEPAPCKSAAQSNEEEIAAVVEAILFASDAPITQGKISTISDLPGRSVKKALKQLNERYEKLGTAFRIQEIAGGLQMMTLAQYNDVLKRMLNVKKDSRLTQPTMETLAIVAYRQPILRADVEAIRGVASGEVLRGLLEKGFVKIVGRAEVIGRPMLYGTTKRFLETFGLGSLDDLPRSEDLRQPSEPPAQKTDEKTDSDGDGGNSEKNTEDDSSEVVAATEIETSDEATNKKNLPTAESVTEHADENGEYEADEEEFDEDEFDDDDEFDDEDEDKLD